MRRTNARIIAELLPKLHDKVQRHEEGESGCAHSTAGKQFIEVTEYLWTGKYDRATLSYPVGQDKSKGIFYSKEYTGCGNGYYALLDWITGKQIHGEWD